MIKVGGGSSTAVVDVAAAGVDDIVVTVDVRGGSTAVVDDAAAGVDVDVVVDNNNDGGGSTDVIDDLAAAVDDVVPAALHTM